MVDIIIINNNLIRPKQAFRSLVLKRAARERFVPSSRLPFKVIPASEEGRGQGDERRCRGKGGEKTGGGVEGGGGGRRASERAKVLSLYGLQGAVEPRARVVGEAGIRRSPPGRQPFAPPPRLAWVGSPRTEGVRRLPSSRVVGSAATGLDRIVAGGGGVRVRKGEA